MKKYLLVLFAIAICSSLSGQSKERKGFIGVSLGLSAPVGSYGDTNLSNGDAGAAGTGVTINLINFGYRFGENFGMAAAWFGAGHPVDTNFDIEALWGYGGLMAGPMYSWPLSDKLNLDLKFMLGYTVAFLDVEDNTFGGSGYDETGEVGLAYDIGGTFRYGFASRWCLFVNADYFHGSSKFETLGEHKISTINLTSGIGFRL